MHYLKFISALLTLTLSIKAFGFQIELPDGYIERRDEMRQREAQRLWKELDRESLQTQLEEFIEGNREIDGVRLPALTEEDSWSFDGSRYLRLGSWSLSLKEWELSYPKIDRIEWSDAVLVVSLSYDSGTKLLGEGDSEIRILFSLERSGSFFSRKSIKPEFESMDYGIVAFELPLGGIILEKAETANK